MAARVGPLLLHAHARGARAAGKGAALRILAQRPHDGPDEPLRVPLEAHLEGLAYTGSAAAEKTIRPLDPTAIPDRASIAQMISPAVGLERGEEVRFDRDDDT